MQKKIDFENYDFISLGTDYLIPCSYLIEQKGMSKSTFYELTSRYRRGKSKSWKSENDFVYLSTIPERSIKKYQLPTFKQLQDHEKGTGSLKQIEEALITAFNEGYIHYFAKILDNYTTDKGNAEKHSKELAVIEACVELTGNHKRTDIHKAYYRLFNKHKDFSTFNKKLNKAIEKGIYSLLSTRLGKSNHKKTNTWHLATLIKYAQHPNKYNYDTIKQLINKEAEKNGHALISKSWVKTQMRKPEIKAQVNVIRDPKLFKDTQLSYINRTIDYAGSLCMIDGTPMQLYYWDEKAKKPKRANLFAGIDAYSGKVLGFDISKTEDRYNIINTFKMMANLEGHLPGEILCDNASALNTDEARFIEDEFKKKGVLFRRATVGNAQDKSQVERFFGSFQSRFQRLLDEYVGAGITSKRANDRKDKNYLQSVYKKKGYPKLSELKTMIAELIAYYNESPLPKKQKSPASLYKTSKRPYSKKLTSIDIVQMFWLQKKVKVSRGKIKIEVQKNTYHYDVYDYNSLDKINGQTVTVRYEKEDLSKIHVFDAESDEYICECKQNVPVHAAQCEQTQEDKERIIKKSSHYKGYLNHIQKKGKQLAKEAKQINGNKEPEFINPLSFAKEDINNAESRAMLEYFKDQNEISPNDESEYEPIEVDSPFTNEDYNEKPRKQTGYAKEAQKEKPVEITDFHEDNE